MVAHMAAQMGRHFIRGMPIIMVPIETVDVERFASMALQPRDHASTEITPERLVKPLYKFKLPTPFQRFPISVGFTLLDLALLSIFRSLSVLPLFVIMTTRTNLASPIL